ncbi:MAG: protein-L-isoaspartate(D-aspartate) O-methyltransferase [Planctomycetaceae bacterium]|nr:protein-L-isoaspartate(D-aspartate) O-methyltransferase [Planctomycetaceae bacterium]
MVTQFIAPEGIDNDRVLAVMRAVPRHEFVRPSLRELAYLDQALDIGHKQTISPPYIVAYMTQTLDPQPEDKVLEIGTGSGYQAAILSGLVKDIYTIEIVEPLGRQAASKLKRLGYDNVHTKIGDGYLGWPEHTPFDKIVVTCSPESVPQPLIDQLAEGGRMIIPLGERYQQVFHLFEKQEGKLVATRLQPTLFVPMTGQSEDLRQVKPDPLSPEIINAGFEAADLKTGRFDHWHYQRRSAIMTEDAPEGNQYICFDNDEPGRTAHVLQAFAIDGSRIDTITVSAQYRSANVREGRTPSERPALIIHFYDTKRLPIGNATLGPWRNDVSVWTTASDRIAVPTRAREAIVQLGLNGATGTLCVDDIHLTPHQR